MHCSTKHSSARHCSTKHCPKNHSSKPRPRLLLTLLCAIGLLGPIPSAADWLVPKDGAPFEIQGTWTVKGRMVVFTLPNGTLSSIRLSEVDLDASKAHTEAMEAPPAPAEPEPDATAAAKEPVMVLTNRDVGEGEAGAEGAEALLERLRAAQGYKDVGAAMGLVNWQDTPPGMRAFTEKTFQEMMEREVQGMSLAEVDPGENLQRTQDGVLYEPNLSVTHRLVVRYVPDAENENDILNLFVGTRLGSYFIASARPVDGTAP